MCVALVCLEYELKIFKKNVSLKKITRMHMCTVYKSLARRMIQCCHKRGLNADDRSHCGQVMLYFQ